PGGLLGRRLRGGRARGGGAGHARGQPQGGGPVSMSAGLAGRIGRLERITGSDDKPRQVLVCFGDHYAESWIERGQGWDGRHVQLWVKVPLNDADPLEHLTPEQRREIRPGDSVVVFETGCDGRNPHLQHHLSPRKRRPYRLVDEGRSYELELQPGVWC